MQCHLPSSFFPHTAACSIVVAFGNLSRPLGDYRAFLSVCSLLSTSRQDTYLGMCEGYADAGHRQSTFVLVEQRPIGDILSAPIAMTEVWEQKN
jgi:hypothetical protein